MLMWCDVMVCFGCVLCYGELLCGVRCESVGNVKVGMQVSGVSGTEGVCVVRRGIRVRVLQKLESGVRMSMSESNVGWGIREWWVGMWRGGLMVDG